MSTILRPVGPQPARVYWIRRALVVGALLAVIVFVSSLLNGGSSGGGAAADAKPTPGATAPADNGSDPGRTCAATDLTLVVAPDAATYAADAKPTFNVTITNTGKSACTVDAGEAAREVLITSGADRIWSSLDCTAADAPERVLLLAPGASDGPTPVAWSRVRSDGHCTADLPAPRAGTYHVVAKLVGAESQPATFTLG